jgi:hypothetical protein
MTKKDVSIIVIVVMLIAGIIYTDYLSHTYTLEYCRVIEVVEDTAVAQDLFGNTWAYKEQGDEVGDIVHLQMYDNRTNNDYDDVIKKVEKIL